MLIERGGAGIEGVLWITRQRISEDQGIAEQKEWASVGTGGTKSKARQMQRQWKE